MKFSSDHTQCSIKLHNVFLPDLFGNETSLAKIEVKLLKVWTRKEKGATKDIK